MQNQRCSKFLLVIALLIGCVGASAQLLKPYDLKLGRKIKEYDRYLLNTRAVTRNETKVYIEDMQRGDSVDSREVVLSAQCNVVSVTVNGQEKEKNLVIRDFRKLTLTDTVDVLPTGTKVRCWFSDSGSVFTVDNAPVSDDVQALLSEVVKSEGGTETSKLMDPAKAVALGATWKMNIPAFRKVLGPVLSGAMKKLTGTVTFASIDSSGSLPTATIMARAEAPTFTLRFGDMPSKSTFVADISLTVPLDNRYPAEALSTSSRQTVSMSQGNARMDMIVASSRSAQFLR
jgi:hypothetical protein